MTIFSDEAYLEASLTNAIIDTINPAKNSFRFDDAGIKRLAGIVDDVIGPFEDHVEIEVRKDGVILFKPKTPIGIGLLRRKGFDIPDIDVIQFNVRITP